MKNKYKYFGLTILLWLILGVAAYSMIAPNHHDRKSTSVKNSTSAANKTAGPPTPPRGYSWQLSFADDFNGNKLDVNKWSTCYDWFSVQYNGCSNNGNNELEWYKSQQVAVNNGSANLTAIRQDNTGWDGTATKYYPYSSGMISTGRPVHDGVTKFTAKYGYYEARMKVPQGKGLWPAFWLLSADQEWPPEIDIMEILGNKPNAVLMTYWWKDGAGAATKDNSMYTNKVLDKGWHTYAINWQPKHIDWYIDGEKRKSVQSDNVPTKDMQIIIDLAVGGTLPGDPDSSTNFPATTSVDYVRYYALKK